MGRLANEQDADILPELRREGGEAMSAFTASGGAAYSSNRADWETPRELFERVDAIWRFDLDAASSDDNALCADHFTESDDGLARSWAGRRVWVNPPYGRGIGRWVAKAHEEAQRGALVVTLIPARTDTRWWHGHVACADEVALIKGRIHFCLGGVPQNSATFPSALVRFGGEGPLGFGLDQGEAIIVPRLVRCAECVHCQAYDGGLMCARMPFRFATEPDGYCSRGEGRMEWTSVPRTRR